MKIVMIHGQNHKGSTYHIGRMLAEKLSDEITEFFLPRDFGEFCVGCGNCFMKAEKFCPHYEKLKPMVTALDEADVIILTSPVYVYHATGSMKAFLDHFGYRWMVHRPEGKMFSKQAVCISTAAGAGMKFTNRDMADSLFFWGIAKIYRYGVAVRAITYDGVSDKIKQKMDRKTTKLANKIRKKYGNVKPGLKTRVWFFAMRMSNRVGWNKVDSAYWKEKGWTENIRPWK